MKASELIEELKKVPGDTEVGYECLSIVRAHIDSSGKYLDLSGESRIDKDKISDTGVFVVSNIYKDKETNTKYEVCGVFGTKERAEKMKKLIEKHGLGNYETCIEAKVDNFLILK